MRDTDYPTEKPLHVDGSIYTAVLEPDRQDGGFTASCKEIPAAVSQGETAEEAPENLADAVGMCLGAKR